ncbi:MAG TPA: 7TM-DISM domain-containing protein [Cyclobacteriaceae bacterium]
MNNRTYCLLLILLLAGIDRIYGQTENPVIKDGFLDARLLDLNSQRLPLKGTWLWFDNQLLSPDEIRTAKGVPITFPKIWNEVRANKSGQGYATYTVSILLPSAIPVYGLDIPEPYCSYRLWANGNLISQHGQVGTTKETTTPVWYSTAVSVPKPKGDTLHLVLQIANFHHFKGGVKNDFYLGGESIILKKRSNATVSTLIECGTLFVMGIVFLLLFFQHKKRIIIYFALFCLTWSLRSVLSNDYVFFQFFPDFNWTLAIKFEYLTLYLTMIWCILFLGRLFVNESYPVIKHVLVTLNIAFILFTFLTSTVLFTQWLFVYLAVAGILILYGAIIVVRASINERIGSTFLLLTILMGVVAFGYDFLTYQGIFPFNAFVLSSEYIATFLLMAFALLLHLNVIKSKPKTTNILTYAELYKDDTYKVK